ncbi:MAG: PHP domain-containing protein, partial [Cytophagales bacterium]|nr:PHP domain-containing protein [Rhizobacter sp.]
MPRLPGYAELHCRSNFSFLSAASQPEELIARAQALRYAALAITDECSLSGIVRAHVEAERLKFPLIVGAEMQLSVDPKLAGADNKGNKINNNRNKTRGEVDDQTHPTPMPPEPRLVLLAESRRGYGNLVRWISVARQRAPKGQYLALRTDVEGKVPTAPMLAGLPGCLGLLVPGPGQPFETVFAHAMWLKTWFGNDRAFIGVRLHSGPHDERLLRVVQRVAGFTGLPVVATGGALMHVRSRKALLDVLCATRLKKTVADCGLELQANAECHLRSRFRLAQLYKPEWLDNTLAIAGRCRFSMAELKYEYPREIVPDGQTPAGWLRHLTQQGAVRRFPAGVTAEVAQKIEDELALISRKEY